MLQCHRNQLRNVCWYLVILFIRGESLRPPGGSQHTGRKHYTKYANQNVGLTEDHFGCLFYRQCKTKQYCDTHSHDWERGKDRGLGRKFGIKHGQCEKTWLSFKQQIHIYIKHSLCTRGQNIMITQKSPCPHGVYLLIAGKQIVNIRISICLPYSFVFCCKLPFTISYKISISTSQKM